VSKPCPSRSSSNCQTLLLLLSWLGSKASLADGLAELLLVHLAVVEKHSREPYSASTMSRFSKAGFSLGGGLKDEVVGAVAAVISTSVFRTAETLARGLVLRRRKLSVLRPSCRSIPNACAVRLAEEAIVQSSYTIPALRSAVSILSIEMLMPSQTSSGNARPPAGVFAACQMRRAASSA